MHGHLRLLFAAVWMLMVGAWSFFSPRHKLLPDLPRETYRALGIVCLAAAGFFVYIFFIR